MHQNQAKKPAGSNSGNTTNKDTQDSNVFPRTPSESNIPGKNQASAQSRQNAKPWERSQSALDLKKQDKHMCNTSAKVASSSVMDCNDTSSG